MRIPPDVTKCVVYLGVYKTNEQGSSQSLLCGTAFFVGVPSEIIGGNFLYLVTAKHVAVILSGRRFFVKANARNGESVEIECKENAKWRSHPEDTACDLSVLPIGLDTNVFDYLAIPASICLTEADRLAKGIGAGNEVFITGLFSYHAGTSKNLPIIRTGNIALIPDEKIRTSSFGMMDAYLIESRSIGGLSGSPVFVSTIERNRLVFYLLGLIHGHWDVKSESLVDIENQDSNPDAKIKAGVNAGIAIVTPAFKILQVLHADEMANDRKAVEAKHLAANPSPERPP